MAGVGSQKVRLFLYAMQVRIVVCLHHLILDPLSREKGISFDIDGNPAITFPFPSSDINKRTNGCYRAVHLCYAAHILTYSLYFRSCMLLYLFFMYFECQFFFHSLAAPFYALCMHGFFR